MNRSHSFLRPAPECARMSEFPCSTVPATCAESWAGWNVALVTGTRIVAAAAGAATATTARAADITGFDHIDDALLEIGEHVLGVLPVALEDLQPGRQQVLELGIAGRRDERALERAVHRLVVGDLVLDVGLVEGGAAELLQLGLLVLRRFH